MAINKAVNIWEVADLDEYNELLLSSGSAYAGSTTEILQRVQDKKNAVFWIYRGKKFSILFCVGFLDKGMKIVNLVPIGDYKAEDVFKIAWTKVREVLDHHKIEDFYCCPLEDYEDKSMNDFVSQGRNMCWEYVSERHSNSSTFTYNFRRTPEKIKEDNKWRYTKPVD